MIWNLNTVECSGSFFAKLSRVAKKNLVAIQVSPKLFLPLTDLVYRSNVTLTDMFPNSIMT